MPDIFIGNFADMHETVLMHADIDEHAEINHVADRARKFHTRHQIVDIHDIFAELRLGQRVADIPSGFYDLCHDIFERGHVQPNFLGSLFLAVLFYFFGKVGNIARFDVLFTVTEQLQQFFRRFVRFRVDGCIIENIFAVGDAQKSRTLGKRLFAQFGNFQNFFTGIKPAVLLAVRYDIFRDPRIQPRNVFQKRNARSV